MEGFDSGTIAAMGGFAGGLILGFAARWGRFCTLGAIEDAVLGHDGSRLRMWGLAIAVAIAGSYALDYAGLIDLASTFYIATPPAIAASIGGGLLFGLGMALVGTCGFGTLARVGGGDLKSMVTFLVMGVTAYATLRGATAYLRVAVFPGPSAAETPASMPHALAEATGLSLYFWAMLAAAVLAAFCLSTGRFYNQRKRVFTGTLIGLVIVWGWYATGVLAADEFDPYPLTNYTFSAPLGESLVYVMTMSGASLKFGIGAVGGVIAGAALTTLMQRQFRWEACDDAREMRRQIYGGVLMGFGSVTALGCTVGQGLSAASLLAWSAPVTMLSIFAGAWIGLNWLVQGSFTPDWLYRLQPRGRRS